MLPDRVSNPGPLTYESGALPIALSGPAFNICKVPRVLASVFCSLHSPPYPTPSPHTPRGALQMLMQWKTMYMPLLHKSNRQMFRYFFSYA